jgi:hypothetical protein
MNRNKKGQAAPQAAKKKVLAKKARPQGKSVLGNLGMPQSSSTIYRAPVNVSVNRRSSGFKVVGGAQQMTDISGMGDNCRVIGSDLFSTAVSADGSTTAGLSGGLYQIQLTPSAISTRLTNFEELYQFYAIRELRLCYTNDVGSSTAGSVALGLYQNANGIYGFSTLTQQQVLEMDPSLKTAVWEPDTLAYRHTGTKLWQTTKVDAATAGYYAQVSLCAALNGVLSASTLGSLWLEYVIDFYKPTPVETNPALRIVSLMKRYGVTAQQLDDCIHEQHLPLPIDIGSSSVPPSTRPAPEVLRGKWVSL